MRILEKPSTTTLLDNQPKFLNIFTLFTPTVPYQCFFSEIEYQQLQSCTDSKKIQGFEPKIFISTLNNFRKWRQLIEDISSLGGAGVLGHGLGSLGHGVLGKLSGKDEADSGLDIPGVDGGPLVVLSQL